MRAIITNAYYTTDPLTIHWVGRKENGERLFQSFLSPIKPYFFAETENGIEKIYTTNPSNIKDLKTHYNKTWEADIPFIERVLVDLNFRKAINIDTFKPCNSDGIKLRKSSLDIETDDTFPLNLEDPKGEILSIGFRDYYKNRTIILTTIKKFDLQKLLEFKEEVCDNIRKSIKEKELDYLTKYVGDIDIQVKQFKSEKDMILYYYNYLNSIIGPDMNIGWYIGGTSNKQIYGFDIPYIEKRGLRYGIKFNWDNIVINLDLRQTYMWLEENDLESTSLEYIAQKELGVGKVKHEEGYKEMYLKHPEKFIVYHYVDMLLVQLIDIKKGISDFFQSLSEKAGSLDIGRYNATYLIDSLLLHDLHNTDQHLPTLEFNRQKEGKIQGGKVFIATIGRFKNVVVLDFTSEYPSIMETFNLSHDTLTTLEEGDIKLSELGYGFTLKKEGFIPKTITQLKTYRKEIKKKMFEFDKDSNEYKKLNDEQRVVKELTNAFYGVMGNIHARLYEPRVQSAITYLTRMHIQWVVNKIQELNIGIEVKYGDTDSVMIYKKEWSEMKVEDIVVQIEKLLKYINESFPDFVKLFNGDPNRSTLDMKFEKIYLSWIQTGAKKNYSGRIVYKDGKYITPYTEYRGMAPRRSDKSDYTKKFITKLVELSHVSLEDAWKYYVSEDKRWESKDISLIDSIGLFITLNKENYEIDRQPQKAIAQSAKEKIKLDRMKGKYKMYFLINGPIAINFDDKLPSKFIPKIDWINEKRRNFLLPSDNLVPIIRPNRMEDFEVEDDTLPISLIKNNNNFEVEE